jgi:ribonuclease P protein component
MKRVNRLRKGSEFDTAYSKGTVIGGPLLVVRWRPNEVGVPRWGFAVGKRLAKQATKRNRTKRRLKSVADGLVMRRGIDIVVTARSGAIEATQEELGRAVEKALRRANLPEATES